MPINCTIVFQSLQLLELYVSPRFLYGLHVLAFPHQHRSTATEGTIFRGSLGPLCGFQRWCINRMYPVHHKSPGKNSLLVKNRQCALNIPPTLLFNPSNLICEVILETVSVYFEILWINAAPELMVTLQPWWRSGSIKLYSNHYFCSLSQLLKLDVNDVTFISCASGCSVLQKLLNTQNWSSAFPHKVIFFLLWTQ